ncbi:hypothetical protein NUW54_g11786 [Trametes sanguinea]|uniref:Uncharacterized protein n=1 Tax=Trametes sanguinea TaxID=158606 RepID=A0ACC1N9C2_9APHY|nr:hypothetical protein NUW54_g11786 [Trametes sanguinea]
MTGSLERLAASGVGRNGFVPTQDWVASWQQGLPLDTIMLVISELLPKVQNLQSSLSGASANNAIIDLLRNANLDQVLPKPQPLSPRRFMWSDASIVWLTSLIWGEIYVRGMTPLGIWNNTAVRLFYVKHAQTQQRQITETVTNVVGGLLGRTESSQSLGRPKVQTVSELLLAAPSELAKKCRIPFKEMEALVDAVSKELAPQPRPLKEVAHIGEEKFTTGDSHLDDVLGGGIRTGMLWEISGENNAGKTQLALQLALTVQLPQRLGGLFGSACYITTREELPTTRAQEMIAKHPLLSFQLCGLPNIFTVRAPFFVALQKVLTESVPAFADERASIPGAKPAKLLIIDTFTDIFDHIKDERYEDTTLRARDLKGVSLILHRLASKYRLAVVVLGGTRDTFPRIDGEDRAPGELRYSDQSRWFARAHTLAGEDSREAVLGHVWPNQLNARIMMSRTIRTRPRSMVGPRLQEHEGERDPKRRKVEGEQQFSSTSSQDETVPFRRFSVIFSSVGPPSFCDYVILDEGVIGIPPEEQPPPYYSKLELRPSKYRSI